MGLLAALLIHAPATWLAAGIQEASSGRLQLVEAQGTVWAGSARLRISGGAGSRDSAMLPGAVSWQVRPNWRGLNLQLGAACCTPAPLQGRMRINRDGVTLEVDGRASQWPAALLAGLGAPWNTLQAEGSLQLGTQGLSLRWSRGKPVAVAGRAEVTALAISSRLSTLKPMGSYRVTVLGGSPVTLELATLEGNLLLSGRGHWSGTRLLFEGVANTDADHEAALANLLNIIGRRDGARSFIRLG